MGFGVKLAVHWFRRDLRLADNTALSEAARRAERVVPVFILEEGLRTGPDVGAARLAFLLGSVESLRQDLQRCGLDLVIRSGRSEEILPLLCREIGADAVYCNRRYEPYALARDERVFAALNAAGIGFEVYKDAVLWEEREILSLAGEPYTVFTPYARNWRGRLPSVRPRPRPKLRPASGETLNVPSDRWPLDPAHFGHPATQPIPPAGEHAALETLREFLSGPIAGYAENRDFPARAGTSRLSPHLRAGTIGVRTILRKLRESQEAESGRGPGGYESFLTELIWREFYLQILANFPEVTRGNFKKECDRIRWSENRAHFEAWCAGRTGYPIVDAAMRCLNATGWMHNRLRMIVAMFLTRDLLLNWQWGERYFMQQLVDGDLAANNGGWQWAAGTGTDAAPYFRIFNPVSQSRKFDPEGAFVKRWIPELAQVDGKSIHEPWTLSRLPGGYPERIVIHEEQRSKCLAMYKAGPKVES